MPVVEMNFAIPGVVTLESFETAIALRDNIRRTGRTMHTTSTPCEQACISHAKSSTGKYITEKAPTLCFTLEDGKTEYWNMWDDCDDFALQNGLWHSKGELNNDTHLGTTSRGDAITLTTVEQFSEGQMTKTEVLAQAERYSKTTKVEMGHVLRDDTDSFKWVSDPGEPFVPDFTDDWTNNGETQGMSSKYSKWKGYGTPEFDGDNSAKDDGEEPEGDPVQCPTS